MSSTARNRALTVGAVGLAGAGLALALAFSSSPASSAGPAPVPVQGALPASVQTAVNALEAKHRAPTSVQGVSFPAGAGGLSTTRKVWHWAGQDGRRILAIGDDDGADLTQCADLAGLRPCLIVGGVDGYVVGTADPVIKTIALRFKDGSSVDAAILNGVWTLSFGGSRVHGGTAALEATDAAGRTAAPDAAAATLRYIDDAAARRSPLATP